VQRPAEGVLGHRQSRGGLQDFLEQRHRPARVRVAELSGRDGEDGLQQMLAGFVQQRVTPLAALILKRRGIVVPRVHLDPVVDALPGHAEHAGDVGGGATLVELQDGKGPSEEAGIPGLRELTPETPPLPGRQVESAHGLRLQR
jgi:hypothetical protein